MSESSFYSFKLKNIKNEEFKLSELKDYVCLVVNVASNCGFTPQYKDLENLFQRYKDQKFTILGFPCNQFGGQEPGSEIEIAKFCELNYNISFPMFSKIDVNGANTHPLYKFLKREKRGALGTEAIKWNFTKFLVGRNGNVLERFSPTTNPMDIAEKIEAVL